MYNWMVVFKDLSNNTYKIIVDNTEEFKEYVTDNISKMFVGYNNKQFDDIILCGIFSGVDPYTTMTVLMNIENKYDAYKVLEIKQLPLVSIDLMQDVLGMSLKQAEGYMNLSVEECSIPFNLERILLPNEIDEVLDYCKHDVDSTEELLKARFKYVKSKLDVIKMFKLPSSYVSKTNAGLCSAVLSARYVKRDDELTYDMPDTVIINNPNYKPVLDLYNKKELDYTKTLTIKIAGIEHKLAYGGIHGAIKNFFYEGEMWHIDVNSYYPSLMIKYNYHSRNIKDPQRFVDIYNTRIKAKKAGDKATANALKLIINTTYGCMKSKFSQLYDPKMANQVCITGQLLLIDLIEKIEPYCKLIQSNTDGIIVIPYNKEKIRTIVSEWEKRTGMTMGIDIARKIYQKDVNNYIIENDDGDGTSIEVKGSYVGQYESGNLRNNVRILDECVVNYFLNGIKPEYIIEKETDIFKFQYITKTGRTYDTTYWQHNGEEIEVNNVNRVYSSKNPKDLNLVKIKNKTRRDSIANLPPHCIVDNAGKLTINDIDKKWYIEQAYKRIEDFK